MDDNRRSFRSSHGVSHHTIVMRKAKDEDERRLAEADESERLAARQGARVSGRTSQSTQRSSAISGRSVSGRQVVVHREDAHSKRVTVSTRIPGKQASVRVSGGDTIIRYQSGDMVVKRKSRRAQVRKSVILAYVVGYLLLFSVYGYFLLTGTYTMTAEQFLAAAFPKRTGDTVLDLEHASFAAMRGNRTPAEMRLAETISFYDDLKDVVRVENGNRLTLPAAAKLGRAIAEDLKNPPGRRTFDKPFRIYRETYLSTVNWQLLLTMYNSFGFFLLLGLFLWRPLREYLGTQGKKTAVALRNARDAQDEATEYRNKYRRLASDIEAEEERLRRETEESLDKERTELLDASRSQAERILAGVKNALSLEADAARSRLRTATALEACARAGEILAQRLGPKEHEIAVDELIADIAAMRIK